MIALYLRLSMSDGDLGKDQKDESNSIENQRILLLSFLESRDDIYGDVKEYVDDGYTGTNFDRPAFKQMIEDAKAGEIEIILVKDLSRLGRDYIGVGDYLEQIFPILGVRFIAVNSSYDSDEYIGRTMGLETSVMNLVNSFYSKDASKKLRTSLQTKWKQGITTTGRAPFGYFKDKQAEGGLRIDPVAARYVRFIFEKAAEGYGTSEIANLLNEREIPTPGYYRTLRNEKELGVRKVTDEEWLWDVQKVLTVLNNLTYTGSMVHGKTAPLHVGSKARRSMPKHKWFVVKDTHKAIVTEEEFEAAQAHLTKKSKEMGIRQDMGFSLRGKVVCGNCGLAMAYDYGIDPVVYCAHAISAGKKSKCSRIRYSAARIESTVFFALKQQITVMRSLLPQIKAEHEKNERELTAEQKRLEERINAWKAERIRQYEAYADGVIGQQDYLSKKRELMERIEHCQKRKDEIEVLLGNGERLLHQADDVAKQSVGIESAEQMTRTLAEIFIDKVYIYDTSRIEVKFSFEDTIRQVRDFVGGQEGCKK